MQVTNIRSPVRKRAVYSVEEDLIISAQDLVDFSPRDLAADNP
jgi:hypothetical protein